MEKVRSSLDETAQEYERTVGRLRRALLRDEFSEDLSPMEAAQADRILARLEEQMDRAARHEEDREREHREGDFDDKHEGNWELHAYQIERISKEKLHMISNQLEEINGRLDWLSEQSKERELNDREQGHMRELESAKKHAQNAQEIQRRARRER